ncbi:hypothetical protein IFM89_002444 [Coptis chinensis]|uniref:Uncharacterized protein n=1 Tax=Coptis chinensis TaxID=261450 RepID=A0A835IKA9_9MAGN|nr:hypothetical protein IFM89_002444 [Coptis chinensis]
MRFMEKLYLPIAVLKFIPYSMQAIKQGFQDLGAPSAGSTQKFLQSSVLRLDKRKRNHCLIALAAEEEEQESGFINALFNLIHMYTFN